MLFRGWPAWQDQPILTQKLAGVGAERRCFQRFWLPLGHAQNLSLQGWKRDVSKMKAGFFNEKYKPNP